MTAHWARGRAQIGFLALGGLVFRGSSGGLPDVLLLGLRPAPHLHLVCGGRFMSPGQDPGRHMGKGPNVSS